MRGWLWISAAIVMLVCSLPAWMHPRQSIAQDSQRYGLVVRTVLATPPANDVSLTTNNVSDFKPGAPISETNVVTPNDFTDFLKARNPGWAFKNLGEVVSQPGVTAQVKGAGFEGLCRVDKEEKTAEDGHVVWVEAYVRTNDPSVKSVWFQTDHFGITFPANRAHLVGISSRSDTKSQVLVFFTLATRDTITNRLQDLTDRRPVANK